MSKNPEIPLHLFQVLEEEYANLYAPSQADGDDDARKSDGSVRVWLPERGGGEGGRTVVARRDWDFHEGHLTDPAGLAAEMLREDAPETVAAQSHLYDEWAKKKLREHLRGRMDKGVLREAADARREIDRNSGLLEAAWREREGLRQEAAGPPPGPDKPEALREWRGRQTKIKARLAELEKQREELLRVREELDKPLREELNKLLDNHGLYSSDRFPRGWLTSMLQGLIELHESKRLEGDALRQLNRLLLESAFPKYIARIHHIRVAAVTQQLHQREPAALSLSGGGIRSGTFALGLLQGLARHKLLKEFDYLSTVSGGGYIGAWLTAWLHRHPEGIEGVTRELANRSPLSKGDPDPRPIRHLREYSNFLTPKVGAMSADTWSFIGIYLRNLLLNWAVFLPLLIAVLMLPRFLLTYTLYQPTENALPAHVVMGLEPGQLRDVRGINGAPRMEEVPERLRVVYQAKPYDRGMNFFDRPAVKFFFGEPKEERQHHLYPRHLLMPLGLLLGIWALGYIGFNRPGLRETLRERSRFWRDKSDQKWLLLFCLLPLVISATLLTTYWAWTQEVATSVKGLGPFLVFGLLFTLGGWLVSSAVLRRLWRYEKKWRFTEISLRELLSTAGAGLLGGFLFWLVTYLGSGFGDPIRGYGVAVKKLRAGDGPEDWAVASAPLAWTDWASWDWTNWTTEVYVCTAVPIFLLVLWAGVTLFVGLSSWSPKVSDEDREWWARFGAWLLIVSIVWVVLGATVIFGPLLLLEFPRLLGAVGGLSGLVAVLVGRSSLIAAREGATDEKDKTKTGAATRLLGGSLPLLGLVFLLSVAAGLSLLTTGLTRWVARQAPDVCSALGVERIGADLRVVNWINGFQLDPHDFEEFMTNVPKLRPDPVPGQPAPSPQPTPYGGFGIGEQPTYPSGDEIDSYLEFIEPRVATNVRPLPASSPLPGSTPCTPDCPTPDEVAALRDEHVADAYDGAKIVHLNVLHHTSHWFTLALMLLVGLVGVLLSLLINLNYFSLHNSYRNRLIRAFLGASRPSGQRKPNPFTGFDPSDNIHLHELRPALLDEDDILDQSALYDELLNQSNDLSKRLLDEGLLKNVWNESGSTPSPSLVNALRTDLNAVLESQELYRLPEFERGLGEGSAKRMVDRITGGRDLKELGSLGGSYRILLNRLVLEAAYPKMLRPCSYPPPPYKLLHVVNTSLNLVGGERLAWQQRKAEPFSFTPLHSGCYRLGYRRSRVYGGKETGGVSLGTAAAVSGAAASSNMGYYTTSPIISLLLTLFNVRLGWWLGNPGPAGRKTYQLANPTSSVSPIVYEAFGLTNDRYRYVYLTDGGHFENLGLYEMVMRRCHVVVVSDAAEDQEYRFGDLGNAVRKIRIDLGVLIEFPCFDIYGWERSQEMKKDGKDAAGMYWAVGRIRYSSVDTVINSEGAPVPAKDGILIYVKPALYGREPRDVLEYRESFPAFPHQSTGDQFFDEPQFESYRMLGSFIMDKLCGSDFNDLTLDNLVGEAFKAAAGRCPDAFGAEDAGGDATPPKDEDESLNNWLRELRQAARRSKV